MTFGHVLGSAEMKLLSWSCQSVGNQLGYISSVQLKMVSMRSKKPIKAPPRLSEVSCLWNGTTVHQSDWLGNGPLSSFQGRYSFSTFSSHASLLQAIDGVMSLALCPQVVSQASQHFRSSENKPLVKTALPASLSARSFLFTPACPRQYTDRSFRR